MKEADIIGVVRKTSRAIDKFLAQQEERIEQLELSRTEAARGTLRAAEALRLKEQEYDSLKRRLEEVLEENARLRLHLSPPAGEGA